jgi:hypothetical protein
MPWLRYTVLDEHISSISYQRSFSIKTISYGVTGAAVENKGGDMAGYESMGSV